VIGKRIFENGMTAGQQGCEGNEAANREICVPLRSAGGAGDHRVDEFVGGGDVVSGHDRFVGIDAFVAGCGHRGEEVGAGAQVAFEGGGETDEAVADFEAAPVEEEGDEPCAGGIGEEDVDDVADHGSCAVGFGEFGLDGGGGVGVVEAVGGGGSCAAAGELEGHGGMGEFVACDFKDGAVDLGDAVADVPGLLELAGEGDLWCGYVEHGCPCGEGFGNHYTIVTACREWRGAV